MGTMNDLPLLSLPVPGDLPRKGNWIDNGPLSNMTQGRAIIRFRSVATNFVEPAYVAAKNPDALVPDGRGGTIPFHERVAAADPRRVKGLGKPRLRGGLIDPRPDWELVAIGAMASFTAQKFAPGTREAAWLVSRPENMLVEFNNWGDRRWGAAFREGEQTASGRNALGLIQILTRRRLATGRAPATASEDQWKDFQQALLPAMIKASNEVFGKAHALGLGPAVEKTAMHRPMTAGQSR